MLELKQVIKMLKKIDKKIYLIGIVFGLLFLFHLPLMTKNIITADVLLNNNYYNGYSWELSLGRFGLYGLGLLKSFISIPHLELILSFLLIAMNTYLLIDLFKIEKKEAKCLTILLMVLSPITSSILLFHYCSVGYSLAFLLSTITIYSFDKVNNKYLKYLISLFCTTISLSMYQAYFSYIITLFFLYHLKQLLEKKLNFKDGLKQLLIILGGTILYFILMKASQWFFHIDMANYSNANQIGIKTLLSFPYKIIDSYKLFYKFFFTNEIMKNTFFYNHIIHLLFIILWIITIIKKLIQGKYNKIEIITSIIMILGLPIFLNSVIFVISDTKLQLLMSVSYLLLPIFYFSMIDNKIIKYSTLFLFLILFRNYTIQVQSTYLTLEHTYNTYHTIINSAINKNINQLDKDFVVIGKMNNNNDNKQIKDSNYGYISDEELFWDEYNLRKLGFERFTSEYLGLQLNFADESSYNQILNHIKNELIYEENNIIVINLNQYKKEK